MRVCTVFPNVFPRCFPVVSSRFFDCANITSVGSVHLDTLYARQPCAYRKQQRECVCTTIFLIFHAVFQTCPDRFFDCASGNITCVHYLKKCDCIPDCDDASDEDQEYAGCVAATEICQNSAREFSSLY